VPVGSNSAAYSDVRDPGGVTPNSRASGWPLMRLRRMGREGAALDGVSPALRAGTSDFGKTQSHQRSSPPPSRPPTADSLISLSGSDGTPQMGLCPSPSMAPAKVRFEHPCSRAKSGRAVLALSRFCPWPSASRSASFLAAWTRGLASANKRGINTVPALSYRLTTDMLPLHLGEGWGEGIYALSTSAEPTENSGCSLIH